RRNHGTNRSLAGCGNVIQPLCHPELLGRSNSGVAYQVQVEVPQVEIASIQDVENIPVNPDGTSVRPLVGDVARLAYGTVVGEYDRNNGQRIVTLTANVVGEDLGRAASRIDDAIKRG